MPRYLSSVAGAASCDRLDQEQRAEVAGYRARTFADSTKKTNQSHLNSYLKFCDMMDIVPVPTSEQVISQYAAYLARRLKPASVKQYLNIVRILHLECGEPHPYKDAWLVKTTLQGIEKAKVKGCAPQRKTPITPDILLVIRRQLNLATTDDIVFWAACLVLFFGLLRKSNLFLDSGDYSPDKQLSRDKVIVSEGNSVKLVTWTKTIQRQEKTLYIQLPLLTDNHPLCPSAAVRKMLHAIGPNPPKAQAFPIKGEHFNKRLKTLTAAATGIYSSCQKPVVSDFLILFYQ